MGTQVTTTAQGCQRLTTILLSAQLSRVVWSLADTRVHHSPATTRALLSNLGSPETVRHELQAVIVGPKLATRAEISALLARLSYHYWRPDFTPQQAALVVDDFIRDLTGVTASELADACDEYRRNPKNRFFPTPGQLLALVQYQISERDRVRRGATAALAALDGESENEAEPDRQNRPRDFSELRAVLMSGTKPDAPTDAAPLINTARTETPESLHDLSITLARRQG